jgi:hypothetical protein
MAIERLIARIRATPCRIPSPCLDWCPLVYFEAVGPQCARMRASGYGDLARIEPKLLRYAYGGGTG